MMEVLLFALPHDYLSTIAFGLLGLLIGSFLNVVIYRLPKIYLREVDNFVAEQRKETLPHQDKFNLMLPRSACPHCGHQITAMENIPVISYLVIGGKCTGCKAKISIRYPLVEALCPAVCSHDLAFWQWCGWHGCRNICLAPDRHDLY